VVTHERRENLHITNKFLKGVWGEKVVQAPLNSRIFSMECETLKIRITDSENIRNVKLIKNLHNTS